eukprot:3943298-Lingulodinium_polyedra.AAC.1
MVQWLTYSAGLRVLGLRDVFHREWNDTKAAVKAGGLWWVVVWTIVVYNLPYGPWDGGSWWQKMLEASQAAQQHSGPSGLLFGAFYPKICADRGDAPTGTLQHKQAVLESLD